MSCLYILLGVGMFFIFVMFFLLSTETKRSTAMNKAINDVIAERERQKFVEGWTEEHDNEHVDGSLAMAAAAYALPHGEVTYEARYNKGDSFGWYVPTIWPKSWHPSWFKSHKLDPKEAPEFYRKNLIKAGALILAEIERVDRTTARR